jgi:hypothetical protein
MQRIDIDTLCTSRWSVEKLLYISLSVSYECETFSLTRSEEYRLRVFKNRVVVGRIFGHTREEVKGGWRQ